MRAALAPVLVTVGLVLAGCLGPGVPTPEPASAAARFDALPDPAAAFPTPLFGPATTAISGCRFDCFEPSIAAGPDGRLYVTEVYGTTIAVSTDDGVTFAAVSPPPLPSQATLRTDRADALVQVAPDGRLFYSALLTEPIGFAYLLGLQIAFSEDGGASWASNVWTQIAIPPSPYGTDRQWLAFASDGSLYASFSQFPTGGIWMARSDDGGRTFGPFLPAVPPWERRFVMGAAAPVVGLDGTVVLPYYSLIAPGPTADFALRVAVSRDRGRTFEQRDVAATSPGLEWDWPAAAVDPSGRFHLAWGSQREGLFLSSSDDGGATWSIPRVWNEGRPAENPALLASADHLQALWFEQGAGYRFARASLDAATPPDAVPIVDTSNVRSDFSSFALKASGTAAVVWAEADVVRVRMESSSP